MKLNLSNFNTPCFVLDENKFEANVRRFRKALQIHFPNIEIGYSVKTNSLPYLLKAALSLGCKGEVVSADEYELAKLCGYPIKDIIYNGPMKSEESFIEAVTNGAMVNIETWREIEWLENLPRNGHYNIGIRVNVNVESICKEEAEGDDAIGRFGFTRDNGELQRAIDKINSIGNCKVSGLHFHKEVPSRSLRFYKRLAHLACETVKRLDLDIDYLDMGGGYFGIFRNNPSYEEYAEAFAQIFIDEIPSISNGSIKLLIEPGNAILADSMKFLASVIDTKIHDSNLAIITIDGSRNFVDPIFRKQNYLKDIIAFDDKKRPIWSKQIIGGASCMEFDRLFNLENHILLEPGDKIVFNNVGAYTMTLTPLFINYFPIVYAINDDEIKVVREKWDASKLYN